MFLCSWEGLDGIHRGIGLSVRNELHFYITLSVRSELNILLFLSICLFDTKCVVVILGFLTR